MHRFNVCRLAQVSCRLGLSVLPAILVLGGKQALATDPSPLVYEAPHTRIRLFTSGLVDGDGSPKPWMVGIEIGLEAGWKTYWRTPGEGIAPSFSWDESLNLKDAEVLWPAPVRFVDGDGTSMGYKGRVVLPVQITPENPAKPVSLSLAVAYGVCKDICMPVEAQLSLDLETPPRKGDREDLLRSLALVPKPEGADVACPHRFLSAKLIRLGDEPALRVETAFNSQALGRDLMVEASQEVGLGAPTLEAGSPAGRASYVFPVAADGVAPLKAKPLILTTVSDQGSCETTSTVE